MGLRQSVDSGAPEKEWLLIFRDLEMSRVLLAIVRDVVDSTADGITPYWLDMWQKWVLLAGVGAITCLLRGNIGVIVAVPGGTELSLSSLRECPAIAGACGYPFSEASLAEMSVQLAAPASSLASSTYRDLKEQAPVDVSGGPLRPPLVVRRRESDRVA